MKKTPKKKKGGKTVFIVIAIIVVLGIIGNIVDYFEQNQISSPSNIITQNGKNTIMIYMDGTDIEAGQSEFDYGYMSMAMQEALNCGIDTNKNNVLFYTGGCSKWHNLGIPADKDSIYMIDNGNLVLLEQREPHSMSDPKTLEYFMSYCVKNYPAQQFSLVMSDHGGGPNVGICLDIKSNDIMSVSDLSGALKRVGFKRDSKLECIFFDACLMGSVEIAAALKDSARYMIASENPSYSAGKDYSFLSAFNYAQSGADVGRSYVDKFYAKSYEIGVRWNFKNVSAVTFSCVDLTKIDAVLENINAFFEVASKDVDDYYQYFSQVRENTAGVHDVGGDPNVATKYYYDLIDLYDFVNNHKNTYVAEAQNLLQSLNDAIIYNRSTSGRMKGLTIYSPFRSEVSSTYSRVCFSDPYSDYIAAFSSVKKGGSSFFDRFSSLLPTSSVSPSSGFDVSMDLSADQVKEFTYGEYYVFGRPKENMNNSADKYTFNDNEYCFITNGFDVELQGNSLKARVPDKGFYASSGGEESIFSVYSEKDGDSIANFTKVSLYYVPSVEGDNEDDELESLIKAVEDMKLDVGKMYLEVSGDTVKPGPVYLLKNDSYTYMGSPLPIDFYDSIVFNSFVKKETFDKNSDLLPFNQWQLSSDAILGHEHKPGELSMKIKPFENDMDYYVMLVAHDIYGNKNCSGIVPLNVD